MFEKILDFLDKIKWAVVVTLILAGFWLIYRGDR
jgi:hypothetical protein